MGFLGAELLFGSLYDKRMEKGKNEEKFIEIHGVGHTYTRTCTQMHICIYTNTDIHIYTQTHRYTQTHVETYAVSVCSVAQLCVTL